MEKNKRKLNKAISCTTYVCSDMTELVLSTLWRVSTKEYSCINRYTKLNLI